MRRRCGATPGWGCGCRSAFGVLTYPLFWWSGPILLALGQKPEVAALAQDFLRIGGLGMIPALLVMALKSYLAALERTQVVLWATLAAVGVNVVLDWALIFGHWGAPELGVRGAAIASLVGAGADLCGAGGLCRLAAGAAPLPPVSAVLAPRLAGDAAGVPAGLADRADRAGRKRAVSGHRP